MTNYLLGLATIPLVAVLILVVVAGFTWASRYIGEWWVRYSPRWTEEYDRRTRLAAAIAVSRRLWVVKLPGGWLTYHSTVLRDESEEQAWAKMHDAMVDTVHELDQARRHTTPA